MSPATGLTIQLALLLMLCGVVVYLKAVERYRRIYEAQLAPAEPPGHEAPLDLCLVDPTPLVGAGPALAPTG